MSRPRERSCYSRGWRKHRWETWCFAFANFLYIKIPLGNPDLFLTGLSRCVGFLFSRAGVLAGLTLVLDGRQPRHPSMA